MSRIEVQMFPCLRDNYGFLAHCPETGATACIDTPEVAPIMDALAARGWTLSHILNTHHHQDHAGGNLALKRATGCRIIAPAADRARIPGVDHGVGDGDTFTIGAHRVVVHTTPGHTSGHVVYELPDDRLAFVGDTLFALGCGRLFEGTPAEMWASLGKLLTWPDDTLIYCAHEYTAANAAFAVTVDPDNPALRERAEAISAARAAGQPTVPTTMGLERATNPFLRPHSEAIRATLGLRDASDSEVFARIRALKDAF